MAEITLPGGVVVTVPDDQTDRYGTFGLPKSKPKPKTPPKADPPIPM